MTVCRSCVEVRSFTCAARAVRSGHAGQSPHRKACPMRPSRSSPVWTGMIEVAGSVVARAGRHGRSGRPLRHACRSWRSLWMARPSRRDNRTLGGWPCSPGVMSHPIRIREAGGAIDLRRPSHASGGRRGKRLRPCSPSRLRQEPERRGTSGHPPAPLRGIPPRMTGKENSAESAPAQSDGEEPLSTHKVRLRSPSRDTCCRANADSG
jgi:hypothetical protein